MGEMKRVLRCVNCGAILQKENPKEEGYISKKTLDEHEILYCDKCYSLLQINNEDYHTAINEDILNILDDAKKENALILYMIDLFSFNGHIRHSIVEKIKDLDIVVIASKIDLFPENINELTYKTFIRERFRYYGIELKDVLCVSSYNSLGITQLRQAIHDQRDGRNVYFIGSIFSGKKHLIDSFLRGYKNNTKRIIEEKTYSGTKTRVQLIPLDEKSSIISIPGFTNNDIISGKPDMGIMRYIVPKNKIKIDKIKLAKGESIIIGGLSVFTLLDGKDTEFTSYFSDMVDKKKVKYSKAFDFLQMNMITKKLLPVSDKFTSFKDFDLFDFVMENDNKKHDISVEGLGWFSFVSKGQTIRVAIPRGVSIRETLSKIR